MLRPANARGLRAATGLVLAGSVFGACAQPSKPAATPAAAPLALQPWPAPPAQPYPQGWPAPPAAQPSAAPAQASQPPLPAGWIWPAQLPPLPGWPAAPAVVQPFNLQQLVAMGTRDPCAAVEVAPMVWAKTLCGGLPKLTNSPVAVPLPPAPPAAAPTMVDLRLLGFDGPVKDQQQAGVCWSFAMSTLIENGLRLAGRGEVIAPLHIIAHDEFQLLFQRGSGKPLVRENDWPYDPHKACKLDDNEGDRSSCSAAYGLTINSWHSDPALVSEVNRAEGSGVYEITAFRSLASRPGDPDQIAQVLSTGRAVFAGFDIDARLWNAQRQQPGSVIADWQSDGQGGHAVALVGYRTTNSGRQFLVHNSWGGAWGDHGYAWISERMVRDELHEAFVVTVGDAAGTVLPPTRWQNQPAPSPATPSPFPFPFPFPFPGVIAAPAGQPGASACPAGQVVDPVFARCGAACANGLAPVAGFCMPGASSTQAQQGVPAAPTCAPTQRADLLTGVCEPACPSGQPRAAGICWQ